MARYPRPAARALLAAFGTCLALSATGCAPAAEAPASTGATAQRSDAIRNGTREPETVLLSPGQQLAIGWMYNRGNEDSPFCTGTLVAPNVVATARHCIEGQSANRLGFGFGLMPNDPAATIPLARMHGHPNLDIAILILSEDATARVPELVPIPFNREALSADLQGRQVQVGGFGETYDRSRFGRYFATVELTRVAATEVVVDGNGRQGICFGDSGGPVITPIGGDGPELARVLGVESFGDSSCLDVDHLVRLDVAAEWIDDIVANGMAADPTASGCEGVDYLGRCDGDRAVWCQDGEVQSRNCARRGQVCAFVDESVGYFCTDTANVCGEVTRTGVCVGNVIQRCVGGEITEEDCAADGDECQSDAGGAFCTAPWPPAETDAAVDAAPIAVDAGVDATAPKETDAAVTADAGDPAETPSGADDLGCSAAPGSSDGAPSPLWAGLLLGLGLRRRRRA